MKAGSVSAVLAFATVMSACDGDSRLFEEAVEIDELDVRSLTILPPAIETGDSIIINPTQDLTLDVQGRDTAGTIVELSASDRRWSSDNTDVLRVSDDGVVTGVGDGMATVTVSLGSLQAEALTIEVSTAALQSIDSLVPLNGVPDLERCLSNEFYALGLFDDQTRRPLYEVSFDLNDISEGIVDETDDSTVIVSAFTLTPLGVIAAAGEAEPLLSQLTVLDTLTELTVTSSDTEVDEDDSIQLAATGSYTGTASVAIGDEDTDTSTAARSVDITEGVLWEIVSGTSNASINNTLNSRGELTGIAEGTVEAQASCGSDQLDDISITINADSDADELSFDIDRDDDLVILSLSETLQLEVSQGDEFDEDDLVTNDVQFSIDNSGSTTSIIDSSSISSGLIEPLAEGEVEIFAILLDDDGDEIIATGSLTVRVTGS